MNREIKGSWPAKARAALMQSCHMLDEKPGVFSSGYNRICAEVARDLDAVGLVEIVDDDGSRYVEFRLASGGGNEDA